MMGRNHPCPECRGIRTVLVEEALGAVGIESCPTCEGRGELTHQQAQRRIAGVYLREKREHLIDGHALTADEVAANLASRGVAMTGTRLARLEQGHEQLTAGELSQLCRLYDIGQQPPPIILIALLCEAPL